MESYVVLARKWRPAQFADIVSQSHVVRTLNNAILSNRIHHAYLFTGTRGVGKTSIARLFAKAIRCQNRKIEEHPTLGRTIRTCEECSDCRDIAASRSVDVIEIDGASNNGVDAVRDLRESIQYHPSSGEKKIILIDEVHMLTTAAFNALLKTLEEPPPHALFLLATTEPHKIPGTILSRCQRFDFRRATSVQIQALLKEIVTAEKIPAEDGALALLAQAAEGSLRDGVSLLDQAIAFSNGKLTTASVRESVDLLPAELTLACLEGICRGDAAKALAPISDAYGRGADLRVFTRSLLEFLHAAILLKAGVMTPDSEGNPTALSSDELRKLESASKERELEELELFFQVFHHGLDWIARSPQPKHVLDILVVKTALSEALVRANEIPDSSAGSSGKPAGKNPAGSSSPSHTLSTAPLTGLVTREVIKAETAQHVGATIAPASISTKVLAAVKSHRPHLGSLLEYATQLEWTPSSEPKKKGVLRVTFGPAQAAKVDQVRAKPYLDAFYLAAGEVLTGPFEIRIERDESAGESVGEKEEREREALLVSRRNSMITHPIIQEAKALFGAEPGPVELLDEDPKR